MIRHLLAALALALSASAALAETSCPQFFAQRLEPAAPAVAVQLCFTSYAVGYDPAMGDPLWSAEHLTADRARAGAATKRFGAFYAEPHLAPDQRVRPADYTRSGFDRGHMTPAGDLGADKPESFSMANMVPQHGNLNRKVWAGIEEAVRELAIEYGELYVVTGPLIPTAHDTIADGKVAVPSHTWKAIYDPKRGAGAYICQNTEQAGCSTESVAQLAGQIGFDPLPGVSAETKATLMDLPKPTKGFLAR